MKVHPTMKETDKKEIAPGQTWEGKFARNGSGPLWRFTNKNDGSFTVPDAEYISRLYFPLMNAAGMKCSITPELKGDICSSFQTYLTVATVTEELHRNMTGRNFWIYVKDKQPWSVAGTSTFQKSNKWITNNESSIIEGAIGSFTLVRTNKDLGLKSVVTVFVPSSNDMIEIMKVEIENISDSHIEFIPTSAIPIFGRHADNIRDHRQVTTMFQNTYFLPYGVRVKPTIVHDERGHSINKTNYVVMGFVENGTFPEAVWGSLQDFIGEGGSFDNPESVFRNLRPPVITEGVIGGKEAVGALRFSPVKLDPKEKREFILIHGITEDESEIDKWHQKYGTLSRVNDAVKNTNQYWQQIVNNVSFKTDNPNFDNWMKWVTFQLKCRQIFGNSYLPDFGYGRGGRGWRDLWQDLLSIFLVDPESAREEIINNFLGIRIDGSNATIIGTKPGEFLADRNNVPRTWCDHGAWSVFVLDFYIQQSGDFDILFQELTYWKDVFTHRSKKRDAEWVESYGFRQKTSSGEPYQGSIFEHVLLQQFSAFFHVGQHNNLLLEGADWNDTLDMARDKGESVCFHNFYGYNLRVIANWLKQLKNKGIKKISLLKEILILINNLPDQDKVNYSSPADKQNRLQMYFNSVQHLVSGEKVEIQIDDLIKDLLIKSDSVIQHIRSEEWITTTDGQSFFNGHYDNDAVRVHGDHPLGVRMDLTSQVMPTMFEVATDEQIKKIYDSVKFYLKDSGSPGLRLCTDFKELKLNLGRITGFVYGNKEHGSKWMQQNIMFMYGLYKRNFVREGYEVFRDVFSLCTNSAIAKIFPGIPSYFDSENHGAYAYLTGSSTWLLLTITTQVFGIRGESGNLCLEPKLVKDQFGNGNSVEISCTFRNLRLRIVYQNKDQEDWGSYKIGKLKINNLVSEFKFIQNQNKLIIDYHTLTQLCKKEINIIEVALENINN